MDYQQITCQTTGKTMKADRMYKIRNNQENYLENVVSICYNCTFVDSNNPACQKCYGTIAQSAYRKKKEKTGRIKMDAVSYRNNFCKIGDEYMEMMDADTFLETIDIIANLNNANWNHGQRISDHLRAYSYPATWKTDCHNCKIRYHQRDELTPCEKAKRYVEDELHINLDTASEKQIADIVLPTECICQEQIQRMYFV